MVGRGLEWAPALDKVPGGFLPVGGGLQGTKSFYSELQTFLTFVSWTRLSIWTSSQTVNIWPRQTEMNTNQTGVGSWFAQKLCSLNFFPNIHESETLHPPPPSFRLLLGLWSVSDCERIHSCPSPYCIGIGPTPPHINPSTHKSFRSVIRLIWRQIDWEQS